MRKLWFVFVLCLLPLLASCAPNTDTMYEEGTGAIIIHPVAQAGSGMEEQVTLYFGYQDEDYLSTETRMLEMPLDDRRETYIIQQLIDGPAVAYADLRGLFNASVRVVSVEAYGRELTVTLSEHFLAAPSEAPPDWQEDSLWLETVRKRRRLALHSIVNTITDLGEYDRVQLQVELNDSTVGASAHRLNRSEVAMVGSGEGDSLLGPMSREPGFILSPEMVVNIVLDAWTKGDWEKLYAFLAPVDHRGVSRPARDEVDKLLSLSPLSMISHTVMDANVSTDGQTATVLVDVEYLRADGDRDSLRGIVVKLCRDVEVWKMTYGSVEALSQMPG